MGRARRLAGSRRFRIGVNAVFVSGALAAATLTILHFVHSGWPLANADPLLVSRGRNPFPLRLRLQGVGLAAPLHRRGAPRSPDPGRCRRSRLGRWRGSPGTLRRGDPHRGRPPRPRQEDRRPRRDLPHPDHPRPARQRGPGADGVGRCCRLCITAASRRASARRSCRSRGGASSSSTCRRSPDVFRQPLEGRPLAEGSHRVPDAPPRRPGS